VSIAAIEHLSVRILLVVVGIGVTILIARIRTLKSRRDDPAPLSDAR
jgi:hypothetical protein